MKYVLDMKDYCQKAPHSEEKNYNEQFYRYLITNEQGELFAVVWFSQMVDSGNIYSVSVSIREESLSEYFEIYIKNEDNDRGYYPERFEMAMHTARITAENYHHYQECVAVGYSIGNTIMEIFNDCEHTIKRKEQ